MQIIRQVNKSESLTSWGQVHMAYSGSKGWTNKVKPQPTSEVKGMYLWRHSQEQRTGKVVFIFSRIPCGGWILPGKLNM